MQAHSNIIRIDNEVRIKYLRINKVSESVVTEVHLYKTVSK